MSQGLYQLYNVACKEHNYDFKIKKHFILDIGTNCSNLPSKSFDRADGSLFKIAMASRFTSYQKRQDILVYALKELKSDVPIKLYLIGDGPNKKNVQSMINQFDLNNNIEIIPFLPQKELWNFLLSIDVMVHACDYEGLSKIVIESMGMGIPVITSKVLPLTDYIEEGVTGFLAENKASNWADKIQYVYENRNSLNVISENSKKIILQNYNAEKNIDEYINQFLSL